PAVQDEPHEQLEDPARQKAGAQLRYCSQVLRLVRVSHAAPPSPPAPPSPAPASLPASTTRHRRRMLPTYCRIAGNKCRMGANECRMGGNKRRMALAGGGPLGVIGVGLDPGHQRT